MEESFMLEWAINSPDQILDSFEQTNQVTSTETFQDSHSISDCCIQFTPPVIDAPNNDPFSFLQRTIVEQGNSSWNSYDHSKSTHLNFGGIGDLNLINSHDLNKGCEAFGTKKQKGVKINSKKFTVAHSQDHVIAERKRRTKLNQCLIELSSIIPYLNKTDKVSILIDAVKYVKELQEKVKTLEAQKPDLIDSAVLIKSSRLSSQDADHGCSSSTNPNPLPEIRAQLSANNILISIHCESVKGLLVKVLSELEEFNLTITHTNLMPFSRYTAFISLTAQIEEGSNVAVEDVVRKLSSVLNELKSRKN